MYLYGVPRSKQRVTVASVSYFWDYVGRSDFADQLVAHCSNGLVKTLSDATPLAAPNRDQHWYSIHIAKHSVIQLSHGNKICREL